MASVTQGRGVCTACWGGGAGPAPLGFLLDPPPLSTASRPLSPTWASCLGLLLLLPRAAAAEQGAVVQGAVPTGSSARRSRRGCEAGCCLDSAGRLPLSNGGASPPPNVTAAAAGGPSPAPSLRLPPIPSLPEPQAGKLLPAAAASVARSCSGAGDRWGMLEAAAPIGWRCFFRLIMPGSLCVEHRARAVLPGRAKLATLLQPPGKSQRLAFTLTIPGSLCSEHRAAEPPGAPKLGTLSQPPGYLQRRTRMATMPGSLCIKHRATEPPGGPKLGTVLQPPG